MSNDRYDYNVLIRRSKKCSCVSYENISYDPSLLVLYRVVGMLDPIPMSQAIDRETIPGITQTYTHSHLWTI